MAYGVGILVGLSFLATTDAHSTSVGFTVGQPIKEYEVIQEEVFCEKLKDKGKVKACFIFFMKIWVITYDKI